MSKANNIESLFEVISSIHSKQETRRARTKDLFDYLIADIPAHFELEIPKNTSFAFGRKIDFQNSELMPYRNGIEATAFYSVEGRRVYLNERAIIPPYTGISCTPRLIYNHPAALLAIVAHEIGHGIDYNYNDYSMDLKCVNGEVLGFSKTRRMQESVSELLSAAYLNYKFPRFDYRELPFTKSGDQKTNEIYFHAICSARALSGLSNEKMVDTVAKIIKLKNGREKARIIDRLFRLG